MNQSTNNVAMQTGAKSLHSHWHKLLLAGAVGIGGLVPAWNSTALAEPPASGSSLQRAKTNWQPRQIPRHTAKQTHLGWEVRSDHFVLFGASSLEQAQQAVADAESAWGEVGQMADFWTTVHRTPHYGAGAVSIQLITDPARAKSEPDVAMRIDGGIASASIKTSGLNAGQQTLAIRGAAVRSFFLVTALAEHTPAWLQAGVADFLSVPHEVRADSLAQAAASRELLSETPRNLVLFFMMGDDAAHAPEFLTTVGGSVKKSIADEQLKLVTLSPIPRPIGAPGAGNTAIDELVNDRATQKAFDAWCADPLIQQPAIVERPTTTLDIDQPMQQMLMVLKLARRFSEPIAAASSTGQAPIARFNGDSSSGITPKVHEFSADRPAIGPGVPEPADPAKNRTASPEPKPLARAISPSLNPAALYRRLCDSNRGDWATLDTNGSLLWAGNKTRLEEIFQVERGGFTVKERDGRQQLELGIDDSTILTGWLEDSKLDPDRPEAHFQLVPRFPKVTAPTE